MSFGRIEPGEPIWGSDFGIRLALFYGAIFLVVGTYIPYFPVWLNSKQLGPEEIGIVLAAPLFVRLLFTPTISFIADRGENHRLILILLAWGTLASILILVWCQSFWQILLVSVLFALFWTTVMPLTETVAMTGVRKAGFDYGRMRLWGSLTFIMASFGGGFILDFFGPRSPLWMLIVAALLCIVTSHILPKPQGLGRLKAATTAPRIRIQDVFLLIRSPLFLIFLAASSSVQATHAVFYGFGTLHWQSQEIPSEIIGALWTAGVLAEIVLFMYSAKLIAKTGPLPFILAAGLLAIIRWTATAFDPPVVLLFPLQLLHAFTFGAAHLGAVHFISEAVPEQYSATAQGIYASFTMGVVMGAATAAAGWLYEDFGGLAYLAMAALAAFSAAMTLVLMKAWQSGQRI